jgi:hypothetical protein
MKDVLKVPESLFMLFDTIVAVDHFFQQVKIFTYLKVPDSLEDLEGAYEEGTATLDRMVATLKSKDVPLPPQGPIQLNQEYTSNIGQAGYEAHVTALKKHVSKGDIIQAVPSQRIARPTSLHPFNIYRNLRTVNPSPYLFFVDCEDFQIIGASPEVLVKSEQGRIITHPIAGTVKRGKTVQEDETLAEELRNSLKDRWVDYGRWVINANISSMQSRTCHVGGSGQYFTSQNLQAPCLRSQCRLFLWVMPNRESQTVEQRNEYKTLEARTPKKTQYTDFHVNFIGTQRCEPCL